MARGLRGAGRGLDRARGPRRPDVGGRRGGHGLARGTASAAVVHRSNPAELGKQAGRRTRAGDGPASPGILSRGAGHVMSLSGPGTTRRFLGVDLVLVLTSLLVAAIGVVMVYTGSRGALITSGSPPRYFLERQVLFVFLGILTAIVLASIDYRRIELVGMLLYGGSITALLAVLVVGRSVQGAARWFSIG